MKLQISYDFTKLPEAIEIAKKTASFANIIEIGTPLIIAQGINAIYEFKKHFPDKILLVDTKIVDRVNDIIPLIAKTKAEYITVLYGTSNQVIQKTTHLAHSLNIKVVLDLIDTETMGQAALDAKALNIDHLLFHCPHDLGKTYENIEKWESVRGNTDLPIFISGKINRNNIKRIIKFKPNGIIIGEAITHAKNPEKEAQYFKSIL